MTHAAKVAPGLACALLLALAVGPAAWADVEMNSSSNSDGAPATVPAALQWKMDPAGQDEGAGVVEFGLGYQTPHHSMWMSHDVTLTGGRANTVGQPPQMQIQGMTPDQLAHADGAVAFTVHRDAGDFRCDGSVRAGMGAGTCVYAPNADFAAALKARGVKGDVAGYPQFELAMSDMGFDYLDELKREAYATPDAALLIKAAEHGAGLRQLTAMNAAGYRFGDVESFIHIRDHGVSARYLGELKTYGLSGLPATDLVEMRDHGVSGTFLQGLKEAGYTDLKPGDLARLRDHGVSATYISELKSDGYTRLAAEDLVKLRDHGVSTGFIRKANAGAAAPLSPDELIRLREGGTR
ncbi:MAG TPA: hypothetical protein VGL66_07270 [Caulobacteraceae bacterium]|jgi:hypothetical protein